MAFGPRPLRRDAIHQLALTDGQPERLARVIPPAETPRLNSTSQLTPFLPNAMERLILLNAAQPERREDLPKLIDTFLHRFAQQLGKPVPQLLPEALELLRQYSWPGNVRELQNAIEHALVLCDGPVLSPQFLPSEIQRPDLAPAPAAVGGGPHTLGGIEREALIDALRRSGGNKKRAAELLGIHRPTLYAKLKRFGIAL